MSAAWQSSLRTSKPTSQPATHASWGTSESAARGAASFGSSLSTAWVFLAGAMGSVTAWFLFAGTVEAPGAPPAVLASATAAGLGRDAAAAAERLATGLLRVKGAAAKELGAAEDGARARVPTGMPNGTEAALLLRRGTVLGALFDAGGASALDADASKVFEMLEAAAEGVELEAGAPAGAYLKQILTAHTGAGGVSRKVEDIHQKVDEVKAVLATNVERVLERGEKLESVVAKTESLRDHARQFRARGRALRRKLWCQNLRTTLLLALVAVAGLFVVFVALCRGFACVT